MATYYIDPVSGNDSNAGTSTGAAWRTLVRTFATSSYSPLVTNGDIIYLMNGNHDLSSNASVSYSVSIYNYPGHSPIITSSTSNYLNYFGSNVYTRGIKFRQNGRLINANYSQGRYFFESCDFGNTSVANTIGTPCNGQAALISFKRCNFYNFTNTNCYVLGNIASNQMSLIVENCFFKDINGTGAAIIQMNTYGTQIVSVTNSIFKNCNAMLSSNSPTNISLNALFNFEYNTIYNSRSFFIYSSATSVNLENGKIRRNYIECSSNDVITNTSTGLLTVDLNLNEYNILKNNVTGLTGWNSTSDITTSDAKFYDATNDDFRIEYDSPLALYNGDIVGANVLESPSTFFDTLPEAKVESGYAYKAGSRTNNKTGTLSAGETDGNKVLNTSTLVTGLYVPPSASDVRSGTNFGVSQTGTLESTDPGENNVKSGTTYKIESVLKTGTADLMDLTKFTDIPANKVEENYQWKYNSSTNNRTGTMPIEQSSTDPGEWNVLKDVEYVIDGVSKTGKYDTGNNVVYSSEKKRIRILEEIQNTLYKINPATSSAYESVIRSVSIESGITQGLLQDDMPHVQVVADDSEYDHKYLLTGNRPMVKMRVRLIVTSPSNWTQMDCEVLYEDIRQAFIRDNYNLNGNVETTVIEAIRMISSDSDKSDDNRKCEISFVFNFIEQINE